MNTKKLQDSIVKYSMSYKWEIDPYNNNNN